MDESWQNRSAEFLSTPSARRATFVERPRDVRNGISIHALREEGDALPTSRVARRGYFYPRPPRGGRHLLQQALCRLDGFLSTPSARRATLIERAEQEIQGTFLSTPSARRATRCQNRQLPLCQISIHALREEGDCSRIQSFHRGSRFLSTPSARRATHRPQAQNISIHALREEGDEKLGADFDEQIQFLSTPSARRATSQAALEKHLRDQFLSTPSARRATRASRRAGACKRISIHALREEGDAVL